MKQKLPRKLKKKLLGTRDKRTQYYHVFENAKNWMRHIQRLPFGEVTPADAMKCIPSLYPFSDIKVTRKMIGFVEHIYCKVKCIPTAEHITIDFPQDIPTDERG